MRLLVYDMLVNVNVIYYAHVCEQARWARSAGHSAIENLCIIIYTFPHRKKENKRRKNKKPVRKTKQQNIK